MAAKFFLVTFLSLFLMGCASNSLCERMGCVFDAVDPQQVNNTLRERIEDLEQEKRCHIGQESGPQCDSQFHWGGSPYYRIEQLECRMSQMDGGQGSEYCL